MGSRRDKLAWKALLALLAVYAQVFTLFAAYAAPGSLPSRQAGIICHTEPDGSSPAAPGHAADCCNSLCCAPLSVALTPVAAVAPRPAVFHAAAWPAPSGTGPAALRSTPFRARGPPAA